MVFKIFALFLFLIFVNVVYTSHCDDMKQKYSPRDRYVTQRGEPMNITVYWDNDLTLAAGAIIAITLRHALGYQNVQLRQGPNNLTIIRGTTSATDASRRDTTRLFEEVKLTPFVSVEVIYKNDGGYDCDIQSIMTTKLHIHIAKAFRELEQCANMYEKIPCYGNFRSSIIDCGFDNVVSNITDIYYMNPSNQMTVEEVARLLKTSESEIHLKEISHRNLFQMLRTSNLSVLFIDYAMWDEDKDVKVVKQCNTEKSNTIDANNKTVDCIVTEFAPQVFKIVNEFKPPLKVLKSVLEIDNRSKVFEEATCEWASRNNYTIIDQILNNSQPEDKFYDIITYVCNEEVDPENDYTLSKFMDSELSMKVSMTSSVLNCTDPNTVNNVSKIIKPSHIGLVIGGLQNIMNYSFIKALDTFDLPVLLYDAIDVDVDSMNSVWLTNGRLLHLALAIEHFIVTNGNTYTVMLSEQTPTAEHFYSVLRKFGSIQLINYNISQSLTSKEAENILKKLKSKNTRSTIFVNTNNHDAATILTTAMRLNMNDDNKFTWIVREWRNLNLTINLKYVTFSFWYQQQENMSMTDLNLTIEEPWKKFIGRPLTMARADAILTLVQGFKNVVSKYPQARDDTRSKQVVQQFERSLIERSPIRAASQNLTFKGHSPDEAVVYIYEWHNGMSRHLKRYRVYAKTYSVLLEWESKESKGSRSTCICINSLLWITAMLLTVLFR